MLRSILVVFAALVALAPNFAHAQGVELTRADRLAILYTPQLTFAPGGEPLIKIGLAEGIDAIRFEADTAIDVLPLGPGGARINIPAGHELEVRLEDGQAGAYRYSVVLAELPPSERDALGAERTRWEARGIEVAVVEVGSIFAIAGQRFDTRRTLLVTSTTASRSEAQASLDRLVADWGFDGRVHAELDSYPGGRLVLSGLPGGVTVEHRDLLQIRGTADTVFTVHDVPYDVGTRHEGVETRRYVGHLVFTANQDGGLTLVNETTLERILYGVVPAEIYASAPADALQAQAVAARSELLTGLGVRHLADPYMTCSDQRCQMYRGIDYEDARTTAAVDATRGEVLTHGDEIIRAWFSANNGGFSASNAWTWGGEQLPYVAARYDGVDEMAEWSDGLQTDEEVEAFLSSPPDAWSAITSFGSGRSFRWSETLDGDALSLAVANRYPDVGPVTDIEILERAPSGRVARLRVEGVEGEAIVERELNIRRTFGGLKSALFVVDIARAADGIVSGVTFEGAGFGHGVGLCQSGAIGGAERGFGHDEILARYYPGTTLRSLY